MNPLQNEATKKVTLIHAIFYLNDLTGKWFLEWNNKLFFDEIKATKQLFLLS